MLFKNYKTLFLKDLISIYDDKEIESFFYIILEKNHQLQRIDLALNPELELNESQLQEWNAILNQLKKQKPIQYILQETYFYGLPFYVDENVLIPRPETEELVDLIISKNLNFQQSNNLKILDIGTGSGCIAIAIAKNIPNASVFAIDVSQNAIEITKRNAQLNEVEVTFLQKNILEIDDLKQQFDIIVSNPPYVRNLEKAEINKNVLEYEPHLALFVEDNDALLFYRKILELAKKSLTPNGQLYFEINQYLGAATVELVQSFGFKNIELKKDIYGNDRMISFDNVESRKQTAE
jgi:release factor glutamine methyltransferase